MEDNQQDICRVCRSEATSDKPLYYPCVCTGSIKYIHQECLVQWLKYSKKEYCELCKHRFAFTPIYSPDMPKRLPIKDLVGGLLRSVGRAVRYWLHYTLVAVAWLGVVPLTACRIYRCLFTGSVSSILTLPLDMLSTDNLISDCFQGCFVVTCTLCAFISLVWLREQILHGGGPDWLEHEHPVLNARPNNNNANNGNGGAVVQGANENNQGGAAVPGNGNAANQIPEIEVEDEEDADNGLGANVAQDDQWNPIEWDRAAEELTWERLLGLDGSLVFLEHVFWVVSLNTLFILVFAFCPYHIGHFTILGFKSDELVGVAKAIANVTANSIENLEPANASQVNATSNITHEVTTYSNMTMPTEVLSATQFDGLLTTLLGYLLISVSLVVLHFLASMAKFRRSKRVVGLCYVVVKVSLLVVVEIGIFPLICGWWLDICSLSMFDATLKDRANSFKLAPGTSMFIHWLVGMVYVFYFASFILLLREVLRPGVLWFLRNLNDPDFNPIQEMIHLPVYRHVRRFLASMVIFGTTVLIMLWMPVRVIRYLLPKFLPYNVMLSSDAPVSELSLELLLLQVVLPALLEQGHTRQWLKNMVRGWCVASAWLLDLRSYLLGDVPLEEETPQYDEAEEVISDDEIEAEAGDRDNNQEADAEPLLEPLHVDVEEVQPAGHVEAPQPGAEEQAAEGPEEPAPAPVADEPPPLIAPPPAQGLGAAHQAMLHGGGPTGFQPFKKPPLFRARIVWLLTIMCFTLFLASLISFIVPVYIGRRLMAIWMGEAKIHELYTAACGLYTCWVTLRAGTVLYHWLPQGWRAILHRVTDWAILAIKSLIVAAVVIGLVPLLLGLLFELVIVAPLRVPLDQTPIFFPWQDWALGVLHAKIICAITMMGPQWWLKRVIEQVYNQGLRNMDLKFILRHLCAPVVGVLGMSLAVPYVIAKTIVPAMGFDFEVQNLVLRRIYPFLLSVIVLVSFCIFQAKQFKKLYEHIKNDKYLVGQRLVNYERRTIRPTSPLPPKVEATN